MSLKKGQDGNFYEFFEKKEKRDRNEPLDIRVYNLAAAKNLNAAYSVIDQKYNGKAENNAQEPTESTRKTRNYRLNI